MHKFAIQWNLTSSHMTWRISGRGKSTDWYFWVLISCGLFMIRIWYMITVKVLCCVNINRSLKWTKVGHCFRNGDCRNLTSIRFLACLWNAPSIVVCLRKVGFPFFFFYYYHSLKKYLLKCRFSFCVFLSVLNDQIVIILCVILEIDGVEYP